MARPVAGGKRTSIQFLHRQRGAVAVFVGIAILALITAVMLVIETGRAYSVHRNLQKAASMAALDAARVVSGCSAATATQTLLDSTVSSSLVANGFSATSGVTTLTEAGTIQTVTTNGVMQRSLLPGGLSTANAVRVTLTSPMPTQFIPLFPTGGSMRVSATATQQALGNLNVGSGVADVNLTKSLLSALLGGNVNVADYNGLAGVNVTAQQLATALGVNVTDLSSATGLNQTVLLGSALSGLTSALGGTVSQQVRDSLQNLAGQSTNNTPIPLGSILNPIGNVASDVPFANLQEVFMALALASRSNSGGNPTPIQLNGLNAVSLPGIANVSVLAKVISPPTIGNWGHAGAVTDPTTAQASTAQVRLMVRIDGSGGLLSALNLINIPLVAQVSAVPNLKVGIDVDVAKATAWLSRLQCPISGVNGGLPIATPSVSSTLAAATIGTYNNLTDPVTPNSSVPLAKVSLLGITLANLSLALNTNVAQSQNAINDVYEFKRCVRNSNYPAVCDSTGSDPSYTTPLYRALGAPDTPTVSAASPAAENPQTIYSNLGISLSATLTGGNSLVGAVLTPILNLVTPLTNLINTVVLNALVNPLLDLLGVSVAKATVTMNMVTVGQPAIVSTNLP